MVPPNAKPTIVLVPGAWHPSALYSELTSRLEKAGYEVYGVDYPSVGPNPTNENFDPDVARVQETYTHLADRGDDILVVVHSAAGIIAGSAARGFSKADREKEGKAGGIVKMVYMAAFAAPDGVALYEVTGGPESWQVVEGPTVRALRAEEIFYNLCPPEVAKQNADKLLLTALGMFWSKSTYAAWKHIPCVYMVCENDQAIVLPAQEAMVAQEGADFEVVRCSADHSPFLSMPDFTAEVVRRAAGEAV